MVNEVVDAKTVEEGVYANMVNKEVDAKTAEKVLYANMVDKDVNAKSARNAHMTYVHVIVWSVHQLTLLQL